MLDVLEARRHAQVRLEGSVVPCHERPVVLVLPLPEEALGGVAAAAAVQSHVDAEADGVRLEEVEHEVAEAARARRRPRRHRAAHAAARARQRSGHGGGGRRHSGHCERLGLPAPHELVRLRRAEALR